MRQRRWLELIKDYDLVIDYHLGKANVVADALSRKSLSSFQIQGDAYLSCLVGFRALGVKIACDDSGTLLAKFEIRPTLVDSIKEFQTTNEELKQIVEKIRKGETSNFHVREDGIVMYGKQICVPKIDEIRKTILEEAYSSAYAMHPESTKMYRTIKETYWWLGLKWEIAKFVARCLVCQ